MAGGNAEPPQKQDELQPHPVKDQLDGITYCLTSPLPWFGPAEAILLGFQHYLVMLGTTVLIPTMLASKIDGRNLNKVKLIQTLLFIVSGLINTLLQSWFATRLPAVISASYTYVPIILATRYNDIMDPQEKFEKIMRGIQGQGALIFASFLQILVGFSGLWRNVVRYLSPLSVVPLVAFSGFGLYEQGFPMLAKCIEIGLPEIINSHRLNQFVKLLPEWPLYGFIAYILTIGIDTQISCRTDRAGIISAAPWIRVPYPPSQWGTPTFNAGTPSFVSLVEVKRLISLDYYSKVFKNLEA
ncbi:PREDICTED: nucleobase-ascorbate transporter 8-like [Camelina sativa]|uniref:Nucleobase-ascorbate transporter 8-like n=1 Tax=Camelina sativa TaxID=90675 RepID=A0ABM1R5Z4_CAMSA|nr:PREDICTED: nucleobase-ascorbate transporter 8-like [Camelina sativa]